MRVCKGNIHSRSMIKRRSPCVKKRFDLRKSVVARGPSTQANRILRELATDEPSAASPQPTPSTRDLSAKFAKTRRSQRRQRNESPDLLFANFASLRALRSQRIAVRREEFES